MTTFSKTLDVRTLLAPIIFSTAAWALCIASFADCNFLDRRLEFADEGLPYESHKVGFWRWELDGTCVEYNGCYKSICWSSSFDTMYYAARSFTYIPIVVGGIGMFTFYFATGACCKVSMAFIKCTAPPFFLLSCIFQGLTLLLLRSSTCDLGFFNFTPNPVGEEFEVQSVECSIGKGAKMSISATVCWFVATLASMLIKARKQESITGDEIKNDVP